MKTPFFAFKPLANETNAPAWLLLLRVDIVFYS